MKPVAGAALVIAALAVTVWRGPQYLVAPSFWAEDGMLFFSGAWNGGLLHGLVQRPVGYLHLYANVAATLAAGLVSSGVIALASAPRVTALAGLVAQLLPIALLAFAVAPAWGGIVRRGVAVAIVLLGPRTGGIWLNVATSQFHLALAAIVVLLEPADAGPARRRLHAGVVAIAVLSGPVAAFLSPLFLAKAWRTRARAALPVAATAALCTGVQLVCLGLGGTGSLAGRSEGLSAGVVAAVAWMRTIVLPVLGADAALWFGRRVQPLVVGVNLLPPSTFFGLVLLVALGLFVAALAFGVPRAMRWWLAASYGVVTIGSLVGAVGDVRAMLGNVEAAARYAFVPGVLVLWMLLLNVRDLHSARSLACAVLVAVGIGAGAWQWPATLRWRPDWPAWAAQVEAWERDARQELHIWPKGWRMRLFPRERGATTRS